MDVSLKFKFIEDYLLKIFSAIIENQNIAKYVYYHDSNNPLSMPDVTIDLLEEGYYHLNFFDGKTSEDERIRLFLNLLGSPLNEPTSDITYLLEIVIPDSSFRLTGTGQLRGIRILDEVAQIIDQQLGVGVNEVKLRNLRVSRVSNIKYNVMSVNIIIKSPTLKGKR